MTRQSNWLLRVTAQVSRLIEVQRNRRAVRQLAHWSDHELRDIGLCRTDIVSALSQPVLLDSSHCLQEARSERRGNSKRPSAPATFARSGA
ncbi:DUF1127 domain-containing protein [Roseibium litorale]|uniref:DUF1127 domain-containing protein n=1 Tax=Roseibium litorale TaxID=2803841 RepID=A0ABR9CRL4_9HYPH|nr:DUF1127 domain-containing protein [Roseibium litorale]MBD8892917.1 DUF1127 domain-containing protein [Roseibium litorale]